MVYENLASPEPWLEEESSLAVRVVGMDWHNDKVLSIRLAALGGGNLPAWTPGAHIDLHLPGAIVRQYSLCGDPEDRSVYRIGVLLEDAGRGGSSFIHARLRPGDQVRVVGPRNRFELIDAPHITFIAGGIGITPLLPMIQQRHRLDLPWRLVYATARENGHAFTNELAHYGNSVTLHTDSSAGRLDLQTVFTEVPHDGLLYVCGPEGLLEACEDLAEELIPGRLHLERFKAKIAEIPEGGDQPFDVICARSKLTLTVPPEQSILEVLEGANLPVDSSCREGICGTCELTILDGAADHRDSLLSPSEQESNRTMMVCVSRSQTPTLTLDV